MHEINFEKNWRYRTLSKLETLFHVTNVTTVLNVTVATDISLEHGRSGGGCNVTLFVRELIIVESTRVFVRLIQLEFILSLIRMSAAIAKLLSPCHLVLLLLQNRTCPNVSQFHGLGTWDCLLLPLPLQLKRAETGELTEGCFPFVFFFFSPSSGYQLWVFNKNTSLKWWFIETQIHPIISTISHSFR